MTNLIAFMVFSSAPFEQYMMLQQGSAKYGEMRQLIKLTPRYNAH